MDNNEEYEQSSDASSPKRTIRLKYTDYIQILQILGAVYAARHIPATLQTLFVTVMSAMVDDSSATEFDLETDSVTAFNIHLCLDAYCKFLVHEGNLPQLLHIMPLMNKFE